MRNAVHMTPAKRGLLGFWVGVLVLAGLTAERLAVLAGAPATDFDDAYMYLRYADHLLAGYGVAWNAGAGPVFGVTSLLHLGVVAGLRSLFPTLAAAHVLAAASGGAAIALLVALVAVLAFHARHPRLRGNWLLWTAVVVPLVAYREAFGFHAGTGMDTMLSALANAVLVFATLQLMESPRRRTVGLAVLAALLAVLARPDNLPCAVLCPLLALTVPRPRRNPLLLFAALAAAGLVALALGGWSYFGSPVPLSFFVKQPRYYGDFAGEFGWNPFRLLQVFLASAGPFVAAVLLFADRAAWRRAAVLLVPALASIIVLFRFNQIMGHLGRFYYPFLPFLVAAGGLAFDGWLRRWRSEPGRALLVRAGAAVLVMSAGYTGLRLGSEHWGGHATERHSLAHGFHTLATEPLPDMDSWQAAQAMAAVAAAAPAGASFAMSEHGLPGALAPQVDIIDVLGLHDPVFARHGFSAAELFRRRPDVIWLPHDDHRQMLNDILRSEDLRAHYDFYPESFFFGLAVRRDGKHHERLAALLREQWENSYPGCAMADYRAVTAE